MTETGLKDTDPLAWVEQQAREFAKKQKQDFSPIRIEGDDESQGYPYIQLAQDFLGSTYYRMFGTVQPTLNAVTNTFSITEKDRVAADRLVLAWNCHDDLLEALELVMDCLEISGECFGDMDKSRAAIAKARGTS